MSISREAELLRMLGRWQDFAYALGFALGTGPHEIERKTRAVIEAAERVLDFRPSGDHADDARERAARMTALRGAVAAWHGQPQPEPVVGRRRSLADVLAEHRIRPPQ